MHLLDNLREYLSRYVVMNPAGGLAVAGRGGGAGSAFVLVEQ